MAKVKTIIKLQVPGGQATAAPPVGTALGPHGINIQDFVTRFNAETKDRLGQIIPVEITVYEDRSFTFVTKTPPAAFLLKQAAKIERGSGEPNRKKVGNITKEDIRKIAELKIPDLNTDNLDAAVRIIEGTARQMGINIE